MTTIASLISSPTLSQFLPLYISHTVSHMYYPPSSLKIFAIHFLCLDACTSPPKYPEDSFPHLIHVVRQMPPSQKGPDYSIQNRKQQHPITLPSKGEPNMPPQTVSLWHVDYAKIYAKRTLGSFWLWELHRLFLFLTTLTVWQILIKYFIKCLSTGICVIFISCLGWIHGFLRGRLQRLSDIFIIPYKLQMKLLKKKKVEQKPKWQD